MSAETTEQTQQTPADPKHAYYRAYSLGSSLDPEQYEIRDRIGTYQELLEFYNPTDEEWGEWVDGFVGLPHTDPRLVTMQHGGQYDFILQYTPVISTVEEGVEIDSVPCQTKVTFGMPSKYGNSVRRDLWAATIHTLPVLAPKPCGAPLKQTATVQQQNLCSYLERPVSLPHNPKLVGVEYLGNTGFLEKYAKVDALTWIPDHKLTSTYTFQHYPNDDNFPITIFDSLDQLVDMIYSLSFDFVEGKEYYNELYPNTPITEESRLQQKLNRVIKRRPIIVYCHGSGTFNNKTDIYTNSTYVKNDEQSKAYGKYVPYWDSFTMSKEDIKEFLIQQDFTPDYFKDHSTTASRRIVIDVYQELGKPSYPLFTECAVVCFKKELIDSMNSTLHSIINLDGGDRLGLHESIDISNVLPYLDFHPKLGESKKLDIQKLKNIDFDFRAYSTELSDVENTFANKYLKASDSSEVLYNTTLGSMGLRLQQFKANFDYYGFIPFRACTELSLLGYKGHFVHRIEGYKKGQEIVHPSTGDLYLCIKDRPGLERPDDFSMATDWYDSSNSMNHTYPVNEPTYNVLATDTESFKKVGSYSNKVLCLSKEERLHYYKSCLPTYTALLSYLNLLIPAHEGLICPPIDPSLFRFNETNGDPLEINNQSTISYYRIFPKLKEGTIADLGGLIKKGLKYRNNENNKKNANYTTDLEEFDIENTPFPYHWLDAYFSKTSGDKMFGFEDISTKEGDELREFESRNAIDDALFGGWHKFKNKNTNRFIYVSSRPVFWTRDPELILGANFLHPRQHHIRIGDVWYWVRILTDKAYLSDEGAQEHRPLNPYSGNDNIAMWDYNMMNDPIAVNLHESMIDNTILALCDIAGGNTSICKRNILWKDVDYSYPESVGFASKLFSINNLPEKLKNLNPNISTFKDTDFTNLNITDISLYFRFVQSTFMSGKKYGIYGNLYHRADVGSQVDVNIDYRETKGKMDYKTQTPRTGREDGEYYVNPQLDYNLQISNHLRHADSVTGGNNFKFITNGFYIPKITSYFYDQEKELDYRRVKFLSCFDLNYGLHNEVENKYFNYKSGTTFKNVGDEIGEAWKKFPSLVNYRKFYVPNNVSHYIPIHIVLEPFSPLDMPYEKMNAAINNRIKNRETRTFIYRDSINRNSKPFVAFERNTSNKNLIIKAMFETYPNRELAQTSTGTTVRNNKRYTISHRSNPYSIGWCYWNTYGFSGRSDKAIDINYILTSNSSTALYSGKSRPDKVTTPDTINNINPMTSFIGANRPGYGSSDVEDEVYHYAFNTFENMFHVNYSRPNGNKGIPNESILRHDFWSGCYYMGMFSPAKDGTFGSENNQQDVSLTVQLDGIIKNYQTLTTDSYAMNKTHQPRRTMAHFYFKGRVLSVMMDSNYTLYDKDHYGCMYTPDKDHLETGRPKPFDATDLYPNKVRWQGVTWDVTMPWLANDRSLHSNQELVRHTQSMSHYMTCTQTKDLNSIKNATAWQAIEGMHEWGDIKHPTIDQRNRQNAVPGHRVYHNSNKHQVHGPNNHWRSGAYGPVRTMYMTSDDYFSNTRAPTLIDLNIGINNHKLAYPCLLEMVASDANPHWPWRGRDINYTTGNAYIP